LVLTKQPIGIWQSAIANRSAHPLTQVVLTNAARP